MLTRTGRRRAAWCAPVPLGERVERSTVPFDERARHRLRRQLPPPAEHRGRRLPVPRGAAPPRPRRCSPTIPVTIVGNELDDRVRDAAAPSRRAPRRVGARRRAVRRRGPRHRRAAAARRRRQGQGAAVAAARHAGGRHAARPRGHRPRDRRPRRSSASPRPRFAARDDDAADRRRDVAAPCADAGHAAAGARPRRGGRARPLRRRRRGRAGRRTGSTATRREPALEPPLRRGARRRRGRSSPSTCRAGASLLAISGGDDELHAPAGRFGHFPADERRTCTRSTPSTAPAAVTMLDAQRARGRHPPAAAEHGLLVAAHLPGAARPPRRAVAPRRRARRGAGCGRPTSPTTDAAPTCSSSPTPQAATPTASTSSASCPPTASSATSGSCVAAGRRLDAGWLDRFLERQRPAATRRRPGGGADRHAGCAARRASGNPACVARRTRAVTDGAADRRRAAGCRRAPRRRPRSRRRPRRRDHRRVPGARQPAPAVGLGRVPGRRLGADWSTLDIATDGVGWQGVPASARLLRDQRRRSPPTSGPACSNSAWPASSTRRCRRRSGRSSSSTTARPTPRPR